MGGERRRRRLRRGGRNPGADPRADPGTDTGAEPAADQPARPTREIDASEEPADTPLPESAAEPGPAPVPAPPARRNGPRVRGPRPGAQHRPSPADLAELPGPFALTAGVHDPEPTSDHPVHHAQHGDDTAGERGLRGLVGGGSSQVNVAAAMRARDASRPGDEHLVAAEADLPIVRRGWVPRDELPRPGAPH
jgi:hypothetical protein